MTVAVTGWRRPLERIAADHALAVRQQQRGRRLVLGLGALLLVGALAWWLQPDSSDPVRTPRGEAFPWQNLPLQVQADSPESTRAGVAAGRPVPVCALEPGRGVLQLLHPAPPQPDQAAAADGQVPGAAPCLPLGATEVHQSGSVRRYEARSQDGSGWLLQIDWAGQQALKVTLSSATLGAYSCSGAACRGLRLSRPDAQGERRLQIRQLELTALPARGAHGVAEGLGPAIDQLGEAETDGAAAEAGTADPATYSATDPAPDAASTRSAAAATPAHGAAGKAARASLRVLDAQLTVPADRLVRGLDCPEGGLDLRGADGARSRFCASGGAGLELREDGGLLLHFQNLEGETLSVQLDAQGSVQQVSLGPWGCRTASTGAGVCQGISATAATSLLGERHVAFGRAQLSLAGATAARAQADRTSSIGGPLPAWTELDGLLHLPSQE